MAALYAVINDDFVPLDEAHVSLRDSYYAYGIGVYETLKVRSGKAFFVNDHLARLLRSAEIIGLKVDVSKETLRARLQAVVNKAGPGNRNIKILLVKKTTDSVNSYIYPSEIPWHSAASNPLPTGLNALIFYGERHFPQAKSLSMLLSTVALSRAEQHGCWDAILVNHRGELCEGSRSNLYWFEGERLYSPPTGQILDGVTRQHVIRALAMKGEKLHSGRLLLENFLRNPCPLVLSSTSIGVQPVKQIVIEGGESKGSESIRLPEAAGLAEFAEWFSNYMDNTD